VPDLIRKTYLGRCSTRTCKLTCEQYFLRRRTELTINSVYRCEEEFPPSYTILQITETPPSGGDTIFANMYAAHDKLSPAVKQFFSDKTAINRRPPFSM